MSIRRVRGDQGSARWVWSGPVYPNGPPRKRRQPPRYGGLGAKPRLARRDYEFSALDHGLRRHPARLSRVVNAGQWAILPVFGPKTRAFSLPGVQC